MNDAIFRSLTPAPLSGRLRLGIPNEFASTLLPGLIGEFSKRYPDVSLEVTSALSRDLLHPARREQFDLILALVNPVVSIVLAYLGFGILRRSANEVVGD